MSDRCFQFDNKVHEIKLGETFENSRSCAFHTIRYDFKPASVDPTKDGVLEVGKGGDITVTVPNKTSTTQQTVFKGHREATEKECILIIDSQTGQISLEKLTSNIRLKKHRLEGTSKAPSRAVAPGDQHKRAKLGGHSTHKSSSHKKTKKGLPDGDKDVLSISHPEAGSPLEASSASETMGSPQGMSSDSRVGSPLETVNDVGLMSDSDSSSADSQSDSSSEGGLSEDKNGLTGGIRQKNGNQSDKTPTPPIIYDQLCEDLELSESGSSDSDKE